MPMFCDYICIYAYTERERVQLSVYYSRGGSTPTLEGVTLYTDSQLLFKATDFGPAVRQLERQTLGGLFAVAIQKCCG